MTATRTQIFGRTGKRRWVYVCDAGCQHLTVGKAEHCPKAVEMRGRSFVLDKNQCGICREQFKTATDHMIHVSTAHPGGRMKRSPSCWACAVEVDPDSGVCPRCGWQHPYIDRPGSSEGRQV